MSDFVEFPKISRLNRDIIITEKIDGTNAQILIERVQTEDYGGTRAGEVPTGDELAVVRAFDVIYSISAGSRNRWLQTGKGDNFGFAGWVTSNANDLVALLGEGRHFGEWWGAGIQRRYGQTSKRFSLFNVSKWGWLSESSAREAKAVPEEVGVVPVLYRGPWFSDYEMHSQVVDGRPCSSWAPKYALQLLQEKGSVAAPGFMDPEGIVVFHEASGQLFKATIKGDERPKGVK